MRDQATLYEGGVGNDLICARVRITEAARQPRSGCRRGLEGPGRSGAASAAISGLRRTVGAEGAHELCPAPCSEAGPVHRPEPSGVS